MSDYISRQDAFNAVWKVVEENNAYLMKHQIFENLKAIQTANVRENTRGHWIKQPFNGATEYICSNCMEVSGIGREGDWFDYCQHCGACMKGDKE